MAVTLGNKKTGVKAANPYLDGQVLTARPVLIRITDLAKNINPENKSFLIYLPDQMLNENQIRAKWKAIDERYFSAPKIQKTEDGLKEAAKRVKLAARNSGYTIETYHGSRHIFNAFSYEKRSTNRNKRRLPQIPRFLCFIIP